VHEASGSKFSRLTFFLDTERLFPLFGLGLSLSLSFLPMRALFVMHHRSSPAGFVGEAFASLGYDIDSFTVVPSSQHHAPNITVTFPDPLSYDAVVVFGGIWAVYDTETTGNWIGDEIAFTRAAIRAGVPVLGICFGGQMLATALGGSVSRAPAADAEIGWCDVSAVAAAGVSGAVGRPVTGAAAEVIGGPWFQWHYDRFAVPPSARLLARSPHANQAFVQGRSLGLQFHPELNAEVLDAWLLDGGAGELAERGIDVPGFVERSSSVLRESDAGARCSALVAWFVREVATAAVDATILT
jgi:GMP synthase-like glutamine amidotransferase